MSYGLTTLSRSHLLVRGWKLDSYTGLIVAMVLSACLSVSFEFVEHGIRKCKPGNKEIKARGSLSRTTVCKRLAGMMFHIVRVAIGYVLMLCVMTMNVWIYVSVLTGSGIGFFFMFYLKKVKAKDSATVVQTKMRRNCPSGNESNDNVDNVVPLLHKQFAPNKDLIL